MKKPLKQTKNYLPKTIKAYSLKITDDQFIQMDQLFVNYGHCRDCFFNQYCGINNMLNINNYRKLRNQLRKQGTNKQLIKWYGFLNKHWVYALQDTCGNVKSMWSNLANQIKHQVSNNNDLTKQERHFINFCLSINPIWYAILHYHQNKIRTLNRSYQNHYVKLKEKLSNKEIKHAFSYIRRLTRRYKPKPRKISKLNRSMTYDENMYNLTDFKHFKFSSGQVRHSFIVELTTNWRYSTKGNLTILLDRHKRRLEIHKLIQTHVKQHLNVNNMVGIDKGFYTLISASTNHEYGIGFSTKIYDRENDLAKKLAQRNPYYGRQYQLKQKIVHLKNRNNRRNIIKRKQYEQYLIKLQNNNIGYQRYHKQYDKLKAYAKILISQAVYQFINIEQPSVIVKEDLTFTKDKIDKHKNKYQRQIARHLNTWQKGYLNKRLEYLSNKYNIYFADVNPAYTSQYCPNCNHPFLGRIGKHHEIAVCKNCGYLNANIAASKNIKNRYYDQEIKLYTPYKQVKQILDGRI